LFVDFYRFIIVGKLSGKSSVLELIVCSCRCKEKSSLFFIFLLHVFLVCSSCLIPEWKGSEITDSDEASDEWTIEGWVSDATNPVG
jgi:hypothetical protein